ncbi:MAG: hypothetical protein VXZ59_04830 [Cyanobacteriota bacterium]|nr:hypothetical protein [Cyanobacteriota bacterium]
MAAQPAYRGTVVLHIGMHKTASSYIQKRLRKNQALLRGQGILIPSRRREECDLLRAACQGRWKPWRRWLDRADALGCDLLVSHETFSCRLQKKGPQGLEPRGLWLAQRLRKQGWGLKLIAFIRDQESYLNSRYTQLIKRFKAPVDFVDYVTRAMNQDTMSECDLRTLFGWIEQDPQIETAMIPFGSKLDPSGAEIHARPDPYAQLITALNLPGDVVNQSQKARSLNQQPGRLGVALARDLRVHLEEHIPNALPKSSKILRKAIERLSREQGWPDEPFNGLDAQLCETIRDRYRNSNDRFCQRFWPEVQWDDLFPSRVYSDSSPSKPSRMLDIELKHLQALRDKLIADNVPGSSSKAQVG